MCIIYDEGNPILLKDELQAILNMEKDGVLSKMLRLKKKVLQDAYDQSLKRKKVFIINFKN